MKNCEILEHTADIRVKIFAKTQEALFTNAAVCLFGLVTDKPRKAKITRSIELKAPTLEDLLIFWLNELISIFYSDKFFPVKYKVSIEEISGEKALFALVKGEDFNPYSSKNIKSEIKAATYHNLKIRKVNNGYAAEVVFDV